MGIVRKTKSVKAILAFFEQHEEAFSSVALVEHFKGQMNKTTVYRILERLVSEGVLHTFKNTEGLSLYATRNDNPSTQTSEVHPHFQCKKCGKTQCIPQDIEMPTLPNYKIDSAEFLLTGVCELCS
jgi:Fur family ferric uptake transcriptional regulator